MPGVALKCDGQVLTGRERRQRGACALVRRRRLQVKQAADGGVDHKNAGAAVHKQVAQRMKKLSPLHSCTLRERQRRDTCLACSCLASGIHATQHARLKCAERQSRCLCTAGFIWIQPYCGRFDIACLVTLRTMLSKFVGVHRNILNRSRVPLSTKSCLCTWRAVHCAPMDKTPGQSSVNSHVDGHKTQITRGTRLKARVPIKPSVASPVMSAAEHKLHTCRLVLIATDAISIGVCTAEECVCAVCCAVVQFNELQ